MKEKKAEPTPSSSGPTSADRQTLIKDFEKSLHEENLRIMSEFYGVEFDEALDNHRKSA